MNEMRPFLRCYILDKRSCCHKRTDCKMRGALLEWLSSVREEFFYDFFLCWTFHELNDFLWLLITWVGSNEGGINDDDAFEWRSFKMSLIHEICECFRIIFSQHLGWLLYKNIFWWFFGIGILFNLLWL